MRGLLLVALVAACLASLALDAAPVGAAPPEPTLSPTSPAPPSNDLTPEVRGSAEPGTTVKIYAAPSNTDCTAGNLIGQGTAADFNGATGITVTVPANTTTTLRAIATDASSGESPCSFSSVSYTHDSIAPIPPTIDDTEPNSPANDNNPEVRGSAEFASTIRIYADPACAGAPLVTGPEATFRSDGLTTPVPDDQTTTLRATSTDEAGNTSGCSAGFAYTEDSTAPAAPVITDTDPDSPANDNNPEFKGTAEAGSEVIIYREAECLSNLPLGLGTAEEFAAPGLTVSVPFNSTTVVRAIAKDPAGNISPCSSPFSYTQITPTPPAPPDTTAPVAIAGGKATQRFDGTIEVEVRCDEACQVTAGGTVTIAGGKTTLKLKKLTASIATGQSRVLGMKLSRKNAKTLKARLKQGAKAKAVVALTIADGADNQTKLTRKVKLKK